MPAERSLCVSCGTRGASGACARCGEPMALDGRYALTEVLGRGASGIVYAATRLDDGSEVAIKEVVVGRSEAGRVRARREVEALSSLAHPGIPRLIEAFVSEERVPVQYLVLERVRGLSLREVLEARRLDTREVFELLAQVLELASHLHASGLVHRDIKLDHLVQRPEGGLALLDLGSASMAQLDGEGAHLTTTGTVGYMPLEQIAGVTRPENDVYAIGALGVALLTRRDPVTMLDPHHRLVWTKHVALAPAQREWLERLLAPDADVRSSDASALAEEARALAELTTAPRAAGRPYAALALGILTLTVAGLAAAYALPARVAPAHHTVAKVAPDRDAALVSTPPEPPRAFRGRLPVPTHSACTATESCRDLSSFEGIELLTRADLEGNATAGRRTTEVRARGDFEVAGARVPCERTLIELPGSSVMAGLTCFHASSRASPRPEPSVYLAYLRDTYGPERSATQSGPRVSYRWASSPYVLQLVVTRRPGCVDGDCVQDMRTHLDRPLGGLDLK